MSAGWSGPGVGAAGLPLAYEQAGTALNERLYEGYGRVHAYLPLERRRLNGEEWAAQTAGILETGDEARAAGLISGWVDQLRSEPAAAEDVYTAADALLRRMIRLGMDSGLPLSAELADYTRRQVETLELSEIGDLLERQARLVAEASAGRRLSRERRLTEEMKQYMRENLALNIGVQDVAERVGLGVSSVSSIFKEETGSTVYEYLTRLRMEEACSLLEHTGMKIAEIALRTGYSNENSFIRVFRKLKDVTPGKYREIGRSSKEYADPPKSQNGVSGERMEE